MCQMKYILLFVFAYGTSHAQVDIETQLLSFWGASSDQFSATAGEMIIGLQSGNADITIGMQQPSGKISTSLVTINHQDITVQTYPNPTNDYVIIDFSEPLPEKINLSLFNGNGQVVQYQGIIKGHQKLELDVNDLSAGWYTLVLNEQQGRLISKQIIQKL